MQYCKRKTTLCRLSLASQGIRTVLVICNATQYTDDMIKSFRHRGLKRLYINEDARLLNPSQVKRIELLLDLLDAAEQIESLTVRGAYLHELKGERKGTWSLRVSGNWRLTFRFQSGDAYDLDLEDYH